MEHTGLLKSIVKRAMYSQVLANTAWLASSTIVNGVLGAVIAGIYARALGVSDFGTFTLVMSLLTLMVSLSDLGISSSIIRFGTEKLALGDADGLRMVLSLSLRYKIILTCVVLIISLVFLDPIVRLLFGHVSPDLPGYFPILLVAVTFGAASIFFAPVFQAFGEFRKQALLSVTPAVTKIALVGAVLLLIHTVTVNQAIWFEATGALLLLLLSYVSAPEKRFAWRKLDSRMRNTMLSFNKWLSLYMLISILGSRIDIFFVGGLLDANALGVYGAANKITSILTVLSNSYLNVLLRDLAGAVTRESIRKKRVQAWAFVALLVTAIGLSALLAPLIVWIIYGPQFAETAGLFRIMCAGVALNVIGYPILGTLYAFNKSSVYALMSVLGVLALLFGNAHFVPLFRVYGAAYAFVFSNAVSLLTATAYYAIRRRRMAEERFGPDLKGGAPVPREENT